MTGFNRLALQTEHMMYNMNTCTPVKRCQELVWAVFQRKVLSPHSEDLRLEKIRFSIEERKR